MPDLYVDSQLSSVVCRIARLIGHLRTVLNGIANQVGEYLFELCSAPLFERQDRNGCWFER